MRDLSLSRRGLIEVAGAGATALAAGPARGADAPLAPLAALGASRAAPATLPAQSAAELPAGHRAIFFDGPSYRGRPTRVFAILGFPEDVSKPVPGVVLVHGGGGTAYAEWVRRWTVRGYAAISVAVEGQTDARGEGEERWLRHEHAGPPRAGIYGDTDRPVADQWMFHAVAGALLAGSLLRADPRVAADRVGTVGISWGSVIALTAAPFDVRSRFVIPIYAAAYLSELDNRFGALRSNRAYLELWEPGLRLADARMPMLWLQWLGEKNGSLETVRKSWRSTGAERMVAIRPDWAHSNPAGWQAPEAYAFADAVTATGHPWARQIACGREGDMVRASFRSSRPLGEATLFQTGETGLTGLRSWTQSPAEIARSGDVYHLTAQLRPGATAWFVNAGAGELIVSSDFEGA